MPEQTRYRGCLLGLACGDAVGTTVEFQPRGTFDPVSDITGGGPFRLPAGAWTDDTSMALCLGESLAELGRFDPTDQMLRYCRWQEQGYLSSTGRCFDIGNTVHRALNRFRATGDPFSGDTDPNSAGNGCIMRLAPVVMFHYPDVDAAIHWAGESSRTTHAAPECVESSRLMALMLCSAFAGEDVQQILLGQDARQFKCIRVREIAEGKFQFKTASAIRGSGYVIDCLEAAAWCVWQTDNFKDAILRAANLGDDADTTAAVCGQLAGAFYGEEGIPGHWLQKLVMADEIGELAEKLGSARLI
jgi:ADP-ribosyl-[dinitrogen reductase] hydrolase